jgi:hypothetical protein
VHQLQQNVLRALLLLLQDRQQRTKECEKGAVIFASYSFEIRNAAEVVKRLHSGATDDLASYEGGTRRGGSRLTAQVDRCLQVLPELRLTSHMGVGMRRLPPLKTH